VPYVSCNGVQMYYQEAGSGSPLLLVHGWPASSYYWSSVIPRFAARHRVLAVDLKGFGRSDKPDNAGYRIVDLADDLAHFLTALGIDSADVVGHSMGGMVSYALALRHPERVRRLTAVSAPVHGPSSVFPYLRVGTLPGLRTLAFPLTRVRFMTRLVSTLFTAGNSIPAEVIEDIAKTTYTSALQSQLSMQSTDFTGRLAAIRHQTLLMYGERDLVITPTQPLMARARIATSRLEVLADCGHCPSVELPDAFADHVLSFLGTREVGLAAAAG
jgi:pimeloyl-ACP methyl ester carboxylesterase